MGYQLHAGQNYQIVTFYRIGLFLNGLNMSEQLRLLNAQSICVDVCLENELGMPVHC